MWLHPYTRPPSSSCPLQILENPTLLPCSPSLHHSWLWSRSISSGHWEFMEVSCPHEDLPVSLTTSMSCPPKAMVQENGSFLCCEELEILPHTLGIQQDFIVEARKRSHQMSIHSMSTGSLITAEFSCFPKVPPSSIHCVPKKSAWHLNTAPVPLTRGRSPPLWHGYMRHSGPWPMGRKGG